MGEGVVALVSAFEPRDGDYRNAEVLGDGGQGEAFGLPGRPAPRRETLRLLKRAIVREVFRLLTRPAPVDDYRDLRGSLRDFIRPHPT